MGLRFSGKEGTSDLVLIWSVVAVQLVVLSLGAMLVEFPTFSALWEEERRKHG